MMGLSNVDSTVDSNVDSNVDLNVDLGVDGLGKLIGRAFGARADLVAKLAAEGTDTWRLFHGVAEGKPGLTIDRYGPQVIIQGFLQMLSAEDVETIKDVVSAHLGFRPCFVYNDRSGKKVKNIPLTGEQSAGTPLVCQEMGIKYRTIGAHRGQDPLLFIDLRVARRLVMDICKGKTLLNLFAYTCGVGVAAAARGARETWNVDFSRSGLAYGKENARLNSIPGHRIHYVQEDVLAVVRQLAGLRVKGKGRRRPFMHFKPRPFDIVFLDPPTWSRSPFGAVDIIRDYQSLFKPALFCVRPGGVLICTNHAPSVDLNQWLDQLHRCAEKAGRPLKQVQVLKPEGDFPSPDGKCPLKIAAVSL